ncbi:MAG: gamma-glutamyl-gamma-aminobutyrate hydrolase family protein [Acidimicrobiia bacterium]|nr:gamma-glutamyl-gamma-aminobutyrate hydrolase family protein [Acidimicrobiia bacterium]
MVRYTGDAPLIALPAYPIVTGRVDGWADPAFAIQQMYVQSLQRAGAQEAVLGPRHLDRETALTMLSRFDGLVLPGGGDVNPERYGQAAAPETYGVIPVRDEFEFELCGAALELDLPILAICRGTQVLNVERGGTLHQHITPAFPGHGTPGMEGSQNVHDVEVELDSRVGRAMRTARVACSCHHHQSIDRIGQGLRVTARDADGTIEAVELEGTTWVTAVQWHPEDTSADDPAQQGLFDALVEAARR